MYGTPEFPNNASVCRGAGAIAYVKAVTCSCTFSAGLLLFADDLSACLCLSQARAGTVYAPGLNYAPLPLPPSPYKPSNGRDVSRDDGNTGADGPFPSGSSGDGAATLSAELAAELINGAQVCWVAWPLCICRAPSDRL